MSQWPNGSPWQAGSALADSRAEALAAWHERFPASEGWELGGVTPPLQRTQWCAFGGRVPPPYGGPYPLTNAR